MILVAGSGLFAALLVLLGESIIEDVVKVGMLVVLSGILWSIKSELLPILMSSCISGATGMILNLANKSADKETLE